MWIKGWQPKTSKNTSKNPPNVGSGVQPPEFRRPTPPPPPIPNVTLAKEEMIYTHKDYSQVVKIYDISYDSNGYPLFLIYINGQWIRKSAKYFKPYE